MPLLRLYSWEITRPGHPSSPPATISTSTLASLAVDYEKPSCLFHLIPLHRHTLWAGVWEAPRARDLTSWRIKVLACMEFAFQEGDWSWTRKHPGGKSYKESKTQACDRAGSGRQRSWAGGPRREALREAAEMGAGERGDQSCKSIPGGGRSTCMAPQVGRAGRRGEAGCYPSCIGCFSRSHRCPVPMSTVGLFRLFSPHWFSQLSTGLFNTGLFPLFIPDGWHNPWRVVDIQLPSLLGQGGDLTSLQHTRRYSGASQQWVWGLQGYSEESKQNPKASGYRVEKGKKKKNTRICSYLLTDVVNE